MIQGLIIGCAFCFVFGGCVGCYIGIWMTERQHAKERKERQQIADLVKAARIDQQHRRVAP